MGIVISDLDALYNDPESNIFNIFKTENSRNGKPLSNAPYAMPNCVVFSLFSGPNTQFKWKLRYSLIQCAYLEPLATHFTDRRHNRIGLEVGN